MLLLLMFSGLSMAGSVELGLGARAAYEEPGGVDALRFVGRYAFGRLALEGTVAARNPFARDHDPLTSTLLAIGHDSGAGEFQIPVETDRLAVTLLGDLSALQHQGSGWTGGLHLYWGAELRQVVYTPYQYSEEAVSQGLDPAVAVESSTQIRGPSGDWGFGLDAWTHDRLGLRFSALRRTSIETETDFTPTSAGDDELQSRRHSEVICNLDLLVRL